MPPGLTDTHAHLCSAEFAADLEAVLARASAAGVARVVAVGETLGDARRNLDLSARHAMIRPAAGLYPAILDPVQAEALHAFIRAHRPRLCAVGEVGLDFRVVEDDAGRELQREIFRGFVRLAAELDLPLNVHSRSAGRHAVALLIEEGAARVQLHAFDGKASSALPAVEAEYFFSVPPSIVRSRQKQKLVKHLPLGCLLAETDSPVLGPDPGARNEPANLPLSIRAIAEIKSLPEQAVAEAVSENAARLYGALDSPVPLRLDP